LIKEISQFAANFVAESSLNKVDDLGNISIYSEPLFGFAQAGDPLFTKLKEPEVIGPHHLLPTEWLPGAKTVLTYFLPFSSQVREANRIAGLPAKEWLYARIEGEVFNGIIKQALVEQIIKAGGKSIIPMFDPRFAIINRRSNWSERHAAFIAGLGTFGLSKSLLTAKGCAGRFGSIITTLEMPASQRPYQDIYQYCTFCEACIPRCPSGAIKAEGKDTFVCSEYIDNVVKPKFTPRYGCGKCQTAVPCEDSLP
jgi:epoxyqueuosine reductase QueG